MKITISSKELEILRKSAEGFTVAEIAEDLQLSRQLIAISQRQILSRAGASSSVNALMAIAKRGFILTEERNEFTDRK